MWRSEKVLVVKSMPRYDVARPSARVLVIKAVRKCIGVRSNGITDDGNSKVSSSKAQRESAGYESFAHVNPTQICDEGGVEAIGGETRCQTP